MCFDRISMFSTFTSAKYGLSMSLSLSFDSGCFSHKLLSLITPVLPCHVCQQLVLHQKLSLGLSQNIFCSLLMVFCDNLRIRVFCRRTDTEIRNFVVLSKTANMNFGMICVHHLDVIVVNNSLCVFFLPFIAHD